MKKPKKPKKKSMVRLKKELRRVLHKWIRVRDCENLTGFGQCISCFKIFPAVQLQAGHYLKDGNYPSTRFEEDNIHAQCLGCNMWKGGNVVEYRINLVKKIGEERVLRLEDMRHEPFKPDREWFEAKILHYKNLIND